MNSNEFDDQIEDALFALLVLEGEPGLSHSLETPECLSMVRLYDVATGAGSGSLSASERRHVQECPYCQLTVRRSLAIDHAPPAVLAEVLDGDSPLAPAFEQHADGCARCRARLAWAAEVDSLPGGREVLGAALIGAVDPGEPEEDGDGTISVQATLGNGDLHATLVEEDGRWVASIGSLERSLGRTIRIELLLADGAPKSVTADLDEMETGWLEGRIDLGPAAEISMGLIRGADLVLLRAPEKRHSAASVVPLGRRGAQVARRLHAPQQGVALAAAEDIPLLEASAEPLAVSVEGEDGSVAANVVVVRHQGWYSVRQVDGLPVRRRDLGTLIDGRYETPATLSALRDLMVVLPEGDR
jgi:hypothetical protein